MTNPRTAAQIAEALEARAAKAQRDFDHSFAAFGEQPRGVCEDATLLRTAALTIRVLGRQKDWAEAVAGCLRENNRAMELALKPVAALLDRKTSYGQHHFGPWNADSERHVVSLTTGDLRAARSALGNAND